MTFSNRPPPREPCRELYDRTIEEIDRVMALPAGDPELLRLFEAVKCPVPPEVARILATAERIEAQRGVR